jgi:hypothetical protein
MSNNNNDVNFSDPSVPYEGPTLAQNMQELLDGFKEMFDHLREAHPEEDPTAALADFDLMAATIRNLLKLGIEDTPPAWEAVLGGFLLGIGVLVNVGPAIYVQLFQGRSAVQIPELLAYQFVVARDGYTCQLRIPGVCTTSSVPLHAHHTHGTSTGMDPAHIVTACGSCNLHVGKPKGDPPPAEVPSWVKEALDGRGDREPGP